MANIKDLYTGHKENKDVFVTRKDKLLGGYNGNLESVIVYDKADGKPVTITNGVFVTVGGLHDKSDNTDISGFLSTGRETKKAVLAGADNAEEDVLFIHNSEVMYDARLFKLEDFVIPAGKVARAYRLYDGDIVSLTRAFFVGGYDADGKATDKYKNGDVLVVEEDGYLGKAPADTTAKVRFTILENTGHELHQRADGFALQISRH